MIKTLRFLKLLQYRRSKNIPHNRMITFLAVYRTTKISQSRSVNNINIKYGNTFQITADLLRFYK
jgi:hypothetical protein